MCYSALVQSNLQYLERRYGVAIVREQFASYRDLSAKDPKTFPKVAERIYPKHYAPIVTLQQRQRQLTLMRYSVYPQNSIANPERYTSFNARRDNLQSFFWQHAYQRHHGFIVLKGFYEWVAVADLIKAGVVTIDQVKENFAVQSEARRKKLESEGKLYRPTKTELKRPFDRQIIICFTPQDAQDLLVPVIISHRQLPCGYIDAGFAIITDEPPAEVAAAGHDRCPVILDENSLDAWLDLSNACDHDFYDKLLLQSRRTTFTHQLAAA